jgi:PAS domain S-box-containing protein
MTIHSDDTPSHSADEQPLPLAAPAATAQIMHDIQAVNAQLLIAGLREQTAADQLRHQLAFTTAITTSLAEGVYVLDTAGRCTFVNPAAEHLLGWTDTELRGQSIDVVFPIPATHSPSTDAVPSPILNMLRVGTMHRDEHALFVHRDGGMVPTAYAAAPIIADGQVVGAVITFRDMTEVRRLQQLRDDYLALISHDLRAPLTTIVGRAQLLLRRLTQHGFAREAESAKIIVESSFRMNDMIEDLLDRSHSDTNTQAHPRATIDLVAMVRHMIDQTMEPDVGTQIALQGISILPVIVEVGQLERVIVNMLTYALKFSPPDRPIVVEVAQQAMEAIVSITDQGIGIAPEALPHLFEKHYRAHAVGQIAGNGLGLYSSRLIMEALGGRIWVESTLGVGSTFMIALPLPS